MKVLTANRLTDGEAVWYSATHEWVERLDGAEIARDRAAVERLETIGNAALSANLVVDVNLIDVELAGDRIRPIRLREQIRAAGPTNRNEHGKQARPDFSRAA
ncbi:DUF2849 domain-containing protein [Pseudaminobacter sp. NGMCC 1.201702]|uniref:DUF2849 domain-containing protein n=1 Tax=Pseudaminobacter sp. NGMCC 1.201702 TaxID=3391825 RepID=UPI0039F12ACF